MASPYDQPQLRTAWDTDRNDELASDILSTTSSRTTYRSAVSPRETNLHHSRATGLGSTIASTRICQSYYSTGGFGPGLASLVQSSGVPLRGGTGSSSPAVTTINSTRQRDKRNLASLNDKFAQYVEKVRFLEAQNRKLNMELDVLRNRSGQ
jgi:intermediate filament protein if